MNIIPAGHKVLVKPKPVEEKSKGGILLAIDAERYAAATTEGTVVAIGPTAWLKVDDGRPWCKPGDRIIYGKYAGKEIADPETGEKLVVIHDVDVVAILKD